MIQIIILLFMVLTMLGYYNTYASFNDVVVSMLFQIGALIYFNNKQL